MPNYEDSLRQGKNESETVYVEESKDQNQIETNGIENVQETNVVSMTRRSLYARQMTQRMSKSLQQQGREISFAAVDESIELLHEADDHIQDSMVDPISFVEITEKYTIPRCNECPRQGRIYKSSG